VRHREAQQSGGPLSEFARGLASGDQFLEGGLRARNESFAGFGQTDTARCADEERCADSRFQRAYRLADRRWSYSEFRGRFTFAQLSANLARSLMEVWLRILTEVFEAVSTYT